MVATPATVGLALEEADTLAEPSLFPAVTMPIVETDATVLSEVVQTTDLSVTPASALTDAASARVAPGVSVAVSGATMIVCTVVPGLPEAG
jgi:hypothetical protein